MATGNFAVLTSHFLGINFEEHRIYKGEVMGLMIMIHAFRNVTSCNPAYFVAGNPFYLSKESFSGNAGCSCRIGKLLK